MPKETYTQQTCEPDNTTTQEQLLAEAMRFFERLNDSARGTPRVPPLEGKALEALESFQATAARLEVLRPE